jgi:periplasmic divalent cation tolerance protein
MKAVWVLCNCNSREEAEKIGHAVLDKRLVSCFDVFKRKLAVYFWPPKSGKKEEAKGAMLILETFEEKYSEISSLIKSLHSDKLPFISYIKLEGVSEEYIDWMKGELK